MRILPVGAIGFADLAGSYGLSGQTPGLRLEFDAAYSDPRNCVQSLARALANISRRAHTFWRDDIISTAIGTWTPFAVRRVPPGYVLGWLTGLLHFRRQTLAWRLAISNSGLYFGYPDSGLLAGYAGRAGYRLDRLRSLLDRVCRTVRRGCAARRDPPPRAAIPSFDSVLGPWR